MFAEYLALYRQYQAIYGPQTAIFLAVGSFYELYDIENTETHETHANVRQIVDYLGIQLSHKKGDVGPNEVGLFAGFPDYVLHKWAARLTSAGWTVVVVDQIKDHRGKVKERKVSRILSPASHVEAALSTETPYFLQLFFHAHAAQPPEYGAALLDLTTGTTHTYSATATGRPDAWSADPLLQLVHVFQPKEVAVTWYTPTSGAGGAGAVPDPLYFRRLFGLSTTPLRVRPQDTLGAFTHPTQRTALLQRIYPLRSLLPPKTLLGLRTTTEELALVTLLQYVEEHTPALLRSFQQNKPWTPETHLICGHHTLHQLQMTGPNPNETVVGLFRHCHSPMGKRHIRERLLQPLSEPEPIQRRLDEVTFLIQWDDKSRFQIERQLRSMYDVPRIHRRLLCGQLTPSEFLPLFETYRAIDTLQRVTHRTPLQPTFSAADWQAYQTVFRAHFDEDKARDLSATTTAVTAVTVADLTPLCDAAYPEVAEQERQAAETIAALHALRQTIATAAAIPLDALHLEARSQDGQPYGFRLSSIPLQQLKKNIARLPEGKITELKGGGWLTLPALDELNRRLLETRAQIQTLWARYAVEASAAVSEAGRALWAPVEDWIAHLDATQCIARTSQDWGFVAPTILPLTPETGSTVHIQQIRHPLVELASPHVTFIRNDIHLDDDQRALLCYGNNAIGKSTLAKSLALAVLLAQAGSYVPAQAMTLRPFQAVYSRIHNNDHLFAGLSSFAVEMSELRTILQNATPYTLVVSDEMANGTESISATALVASSLHWLCQRQTKCIMATHLHDLPKYIDPQDRIAIKHLHVEYDPVTQKLIYHRTLREGQGSSLYGIEVARAMALPFDFIEHALATRHRIAGSATVQDAPASAWNATVTRRQCERCGHTVLRDLEVHHIQPRAAATRGMLPDGTPMNRESNLMVLCQACHDEHHRGAFEIGPAIQTTDGVERLPAPVTPATPATPATAATVATAATERTAIPGERRSKWTAEEMETVKGVLRTYPSLSLKSLRSYLSATYTIEVSEGVLSRWRRELSGL